VEFTDSGERKDKEHVPKVIKSESEWKQQLSPGAYNVRWEYGTEMAFTGHWNNTKRDSYRWFAVDGRSSALIPSLNLAPAASFYQPIAKKT